MASKTWASYIAGQSLPPLGWGHHSVTVTRTKRAVTACYSFTWALISSPWVVVAVMVASQTWV